MRLFVQKACTIENLTHSEGLINVAYYLAGQFLLYICPNGSYFVHPQSSLSSHVEHLLGFLPSFPWPVVLGFTWVGCSPDWPANQSFIFFSWPTLTHSSGLTLFVPICQAAFPDILVILYYIILYSAFNLLCHYCLFIFCKTISSACGKWEGESLPWAPELSVVPMHNEHSSILVR